MRPMVVARAVAAAFLVVGTLFTAAPAVPAGTSDLDSFVRQERADLKLSGLAVVVLTRGAVTFEGAYGDAAPGGPAVTLDTPFLLGSTSKQFTALIIQQLIAQRSLSETDTIADLLPGAEGEYGSVTVADLLSHTSGISQRTGNEEFDPWPAVTTIRGEAERDLRTAPDSKPGTTFEYSNANYTVLGAIIERVTGTPFEEALQAFVAKPLGLTSTTSDLAAARANGLAVGHYTWLGQVDSTTPAPTWPMGAPSAYVTSDARDLTRLIQAELGDSALFSAAQEPIARVDDYNRYASGWYVRPFWESNDDDANFDDPALPKIWEHNGDAQRSMSYLAFVPDLGLGVVVLTNSGMGTDTARLSRFTYQLLHKIVGTSASPQAVDPLISAAPIIMVGLPLLQLLAVGILLFRRRSRVVPLILSGLVTALSLVVTLVVVPGQTKLPVLDRGWWSSVPDLAMSVGLTLLFVACWAVAAVSVVLKQQRSPGGNRPEAPPL